MLLSPSGEQMKKVHLLAEFCSGRQSLPIHAEHNSFPPQTFQGDFPCCPEQQRADRRSCPRSRSRDISAITALTGKLTVFPFMLAACIVAFLYILQHDFASYSSSSYVQTPSSAPCLFTLSTTLGPSPTLRLQAPLTKDCLFLCAFICTGELLNLFTIDPSQDTGNLKIY